MAAALTRHVQLSTWEVSWWEFGKMNSGLVRASVTPVAFTAALWFAYPTTAQDEPSPWFVCGNNFVTVDVARPGDAIEIETIRKSSILRVCFEDRDITIQFKIGDKSGVLMF